jgi:hypothetical protein
MGRQIALLSVLLFAAAPRASLAQDWLPGESLAVELDKLSEEMERRERLFGSLARRLEEIRVLVEAARGVPSGEQFDQKEAEVRALEAELASSSQRIRALRDSVRAREEQLRAGEDRLVELRAQLPEPSESLSGLWDVTLAPGGSRAVFALRQSGTLVSGEYLQDGGHHGSLQGTLVDGKVFLSRIDSRVGRSMELEGVVNRDGTLIRGTWQSLDVSGGRPGSGAWQARRRRESGAEGESGGEGAEPGTAKPSE